MPMRGTLLLLSRVLQEVQNFKDKIIPVVHKLFKKTEKKNYDSKGSKTSKYSTKH